MTRDHACRCHLLSATTLKWRESCAHSRFRENFGRRGRSCVLAVCLSVRRAYRWALGGGQRLRQSRMPRFVQGAGPHNTPRQTEGVAGDWPSRTHGRAAAQISPRLGDRAPHGVGSPRGPPRRFYDNSPASGSLPCGQGISSSGDNATTDSSGSINVTLAMCDRLGQSPASPTLSRAPRAARPAYVDHSGSRLAQSGRTRRFAGDHVLGGLFNDLCRCPPGASSPAPCTCRRSSAWIEIHG